MRKLLTELLTQNAETFVNDERGDFSLKGLAITVGVIIVVGVAAGTITGQLPDWIDEVWTGVWGWVNGFLFTDIG